MSSAADQRRSSVPIQPLFVGYSAYVPCRKSVPAEETSCTPTASC